jgi:hypothetical protein
VGALELVLAASVLGVAFARLWTARAAWISPWVVLSEEGELLAWVDTVSVLRGGALSRDVFCLYGPLSIWPVAWLFAAFGPSLGLWRHWIFALNGPALLATYLLLRGLLRSRSGAIGGTAVVGLLCAPAVPALSWSLSRVGLAGGSCMSLARARARRSALVRRHGLAARRRASVQPGGGLGAGTETATLEMALLNRPSACHILRKE